MANAVSHQNPALVALLGLCPLLAVSTTVATGFGLGIATTVTMVLSSVVISSIRQLIPGDIRLPVFVLTIASIVTFVEFLLRAYRFEFYQSAGLFIPLIVTNCVILARIESVAYRQQINLAAWDAFSMGFGFSLVLIILGSIREILGFGTLFTGAELLFGQTAVDWKLTIPGFNQGFLLAILPPGAFFGLALLIAIKNSLGKSGVSSQKKRPLQPSASSDQQTVPAE
ncbi:MAG: electron transport complex subunit E [Gammaproteobacteria bacterium]|nr:electron transport complex subunit E [Gammaproteobacteria bacterium]